MSDREQTYPQDGGGVPPLVFIAPALIVGAVIFLLARRNGSSANRAVDSARDAARDTVQEASRKGGNTTRRLALTTLINALENDAARRVVITGLKFVRDRS